MSKKAKVAILTRAGFPYHTRITQAYLKQIEREEYDWVRPTLYFCQTPKIDTMIAQVNEILDEQFDLIVTTGSLFTETAINVCKKNNATIPIVFAGVTLSSRMSHLVASYRCIGVTRDDPHPITIAAKLFHQIKPSAQSLLLPHSPNGSHGSVTKQATLIKEELNSLGTSTTLFPISNMKTMYSEIKHELETNNYDSLMYLEGCLVEEIYEELCTLCNHLGVTLFAHNIEALYAGAAIALGEDVGHMGKHAFDLTMQLLNEEKTIDKLCTIAVPNGRRIAVNTLAAQQQNLALDDELLFCLQNGLVLEE